METQAYSHEYAARLFSEYADIDDDNVEYLSVEKLAALAVKANLFSAKAQTRLIGQCSTNYAAEHKFLLEVAPALSARVAERLRRADAYKDGGEEVWGKRLREFEIRASSEKYSFRCNSGFITRRIAAWITCRILLEYSAILMRKAEVERLFPEKLGRICGVPGLGVVSDTRPIKVENISALVRSSINSSNKK